MQICLLRLVGLALPEDTVDRIRNTYAVNTKIYWKQPNDSKGEKIVKCNLKCTYGGKTS